MRQNPDLAARRLRLAQAGAMLNAVGLKAGAIRVGIKDETIIAVDTYLVCRNFSYGIIISCNGVCLDAILSF